MNMTKSKKRTSRKYMGEWIVPCGINSSGMRWHTRDTINGMILKADTLDGIKHLIRSER